MAGYQPELYAGKNCTVAYRRRGCYPETGVQMVTFRRIFGHGVRVRHLACRNISEGALLVFRMQSACRPNARMPGRGGTKDCSERSGRPGQYSGFRKKVAYASGTT